MSKTKKFLLIFFTIVICILIVIGSLYAYLFFTDKLDKNVQTQIIDALFTEENYPKVDGISLMTNLAIAYEKNFTGNDNVDLSFSQTEDEAYDNLIKGNCNLILVTSPTETELNKAKSAGITLEVRQILNEGFVFYTSIENKVDNVTLEQAKKIYTGEIRNWNVVGGDNFEIKAFQKENN